MKDLRLKLKLWLSLMAFLFCLTIHSQNKKPVVAITNATMKWDNQDLNVTYDLDDQDSGRIDVTLTLLTKSGEKLPISELKGEIGYPIGRGEGKQISCKLPKWFSEREFVVMLNADDRYEAPMSEQIAELVAQVDTNNIKKNLLSVYGVRDRSEEGAEHLEKTRSLLLDSFQSYGLEAKKEEITESWYDFVMMAIERLEIPKENAPARPDKEVFYNIQNLIGTLAGNKEPEQTFVLGAHYDSAPESPGGDDNATGVAGMMEAARILSKYSFNKTIKFVAFDLEEQQKMGSWFYLAKKPKTEVIDGFINFDMIGYYSENANTQTIPEGFETLYPEVTNAVKEDQYRGNFILITNNERSVKLAERFKSNASIYSDRLRAFSLTALRNGADTPQLKNSDHWTFWDTRYNAIHVGDAGETRNSNLNTKYDTLKNLDYSFMRKVVQATIATIAEYAEIQHSSQATFVVSIKP